MPTNNRNETLNTSRNNNGYYFQQNRTIRRQLEFLVDMWHKYFMGEMSLLWPKPQCKSTEENYCNNSIWLQAAHTDQMIKHHYIFNQVKTQN